jgi:phosphoserine phosphatase
MAVSDIIAVVFDFDDTLAPDTTTRLLQEHRIDAERFWSEDVASLVEDGYEPSLAWLKLLLDNVQPGRPLEGLSNQGLREFGATVDATFFDGLPGLFDDLRAQAAQERDVAVEFYVISGGLRQLLLGSSVVQKYFDGVYGSELADGPDGTLASIKRSVTFTEKTRYLYEINKGIKVEDSLRNPLLVNEDIPKSERRIRLDDMIYVGDGLTDIPCFSTLREAKGISFGVFDPSQQAKAKRAFLKLLVPQRVVGIHAPKYGPDAELGALLRAAVEQKIATAKLRRASVY